MLSDGDKIRTTKSLVVEEGFCGVIIQRIKRGALGQNYDYYVRLSDGRVVVLWANEMQLYETPWDRFIKNAHRRS